MIRACTYKSGAADQGVFDVRYAPDSGAKADVAGGPGWVNRVGLNACRSFLRFPDYRTFSEAVGMSQTCQFPTHARSKPKISRGASRLGRTIFSPFLQFCASSGPPSTALQCNPDKSKRLCCGGAGGQKYRLPALQKSNDHCTPNLLSDRSLQALFDR